MASKKLSIRSANASAITEVLKIQSETGLSFWSEEDYKQEIERKDSIFKVAISNGEIIGFAVLRLLVGDEIKRFETAEILNIAVSKAFQRQNFGQEIFDAILADVIELDIKEIWLEVRESNVQAIKFYKKNAFKEKFVRKNYYSNPTEDALILVRK